MPVANLPIQLAGGVSHPSIPLLTFFPDDNASADDTWTRGAIIGESNNTAGYVEELAADPTAGTILGVASHKWPPSVTSPTIATHIKVVPALPGVVFEGTLNTSAGTYTLALTDMMAAYGLAVDGNGIWYVDQGDTTNTRVFVLSPISASGEAFPRVKFVFNPDATVFGLASG